MTVRRKEYGSLHELLTGKPDADKIYQFWLFPSTVVHSYHNKDNRGEKIPLTKGVYPLHYPFLYEIETRLPLTKDGKEADPKDKTAELKTVVLRHSVGEFEILKHLQTPDKDKKHKITMDDFVDGHLSLKGTEANKLRILSLSDEFFNNPNRNTKIRAKFFLRDEDVEIDKQMEVEDKRFEIEAFVRNPENLDIVCAYARVILPASEYERLAVNPKMIVMRIVGLVKQDPTTHEAGFKNPKNLNIHYLKEAIENKIIYIEPSQNAIYMSRDNSLVKMSPIGIDVLRKFSEDIYDDVTGASKNKYEEIISKLPQYKKSAKKEVVIEPKEEVEETEPKETITYTNEELKALLDKGVERGLITYFGKAGGFRICETSDFVAKTYMGLKPFKKEMESNLEYASKIEQMLA